MDFWLSEYGSDFGSHVFGRFLTDKNFAVSALAEGSVAGDYTQRDI